jgi:glycosyltransferase involved in cell wall biosynthesis
VSALLSTMDVLVAPSEEAFGLSVIEALAAGLSVLYITCPSLDDLPVGSAPGAHRLPADPDAIRCARRCGTERKAPPAAATGARPLRHRRVAARVSAFYERLTGLAPHKQANIREEQSWPAQPIS